MKSQTRVPGNPGHHAVQFYSDDDRLCVSVADFLGDGLAAGQPLIIIATPSHRDRIIAELRTRHFDVDSLVASGKIQVLDAAETLTHFMVNGRPDHLLFRRVVSSVLDGVITSSGERNVRAYGEMVDVLWRSGHPEAALRLEALWNDLAKTHDFSLMCGYANGNFVQPTGKEDVCAQHTHVYQAV